MKVCQIVAGTGAGGLEKHIIELSRLLTKRGVDVTVIAHESFESELKGVNFIPLDLTKSRKNIFVLYKLLKILKKHQFDIIHTQANKATAMVMSLKSFLNSKFVATLHNLKSNLKAFEKVDHVITVSNKIGQRLNNKKTTIYNGINLDINSIKKIDLHEKFNIPKDEFIICSIARFTKVKRFDILLKALEKTSNVHLILVGAGEEDDSLKSLVKQLGIESKVDFTGMLENTKAKEILLSSSLFVMSSDNEGFPYTFIESMFCKTPFLSTPVSDIEQIISDKYIVNFEDYVSLGDKIEFIKNNYDEVKKDYEEIFEFSQKEFTLENMTNKTLDIYKSL